jgi:hypothetical protein
MLPVEEHKPVLTADMRSGAADLQENGARLGGNRAPACQKRLGKIRRRRGNGAVFRENSRSLRS